MSEDVLLREFREFLAKLAVDRPDLVRDAMSGAAAAPPPTFRSLWAQYEAARRRFVASWDRITVFHAAHLLAMWGDLPHTAIDHASADVYVLSRLAAEAGHSGRKVSPNTVNRELETLSCCLAWCVKRKLIPANAIEDYKRPSAPVKRDRPMTREERAKVLLASIHPQARLMFGLAFETGMRRDEWRCVLWSEVNREAMRIELPAGRTKARKARNVPLSAEALRLISAAPRWSRYVFPSPFCRQGEDSPVSTNTLHRWWKKTLKRAGLEDRRLHSIRLTFGTWAAYDLGMPLRMAMAVMGHSSKEVHDIYVSFGPEFEGDVRAFLDGERKGPQPARREDVERAILQLADE